MDWGRLGAQLNAPFRAAASDIQRSFAAAGPAFSRTGAGVSGALGGFGAFLSKPQPLFAAVGPFAARATSLLPPSVNRETAQGFQQYVSLTSFSFGRVNPPPRNSILGSLNIGGGAAALFIFPASPEDAAAASADALRFADGTKLADYLGQAAAAGDRAAAESSTVLGADVSKAAAQGIADARAALTVTKTDSLAALYKGLGTAAKYGVPIAAVGATIGLVAPYAGLGLGQGFANVGYGIGSGLYNIGAGLTGGQAAGTSGGYGAGGVSGGSPPTAQSLLSSPIFLLLLVGGGLLVAYEVTKHSGKSGS